MPSPRADERPWPRRSVLTTGLGAGLSLLAGGCTLSDPAIRGSGVPAPPGSTAAPSPTPSRTAPLTASATAAVAERRLADLAERVRTGSSTTSSAQRSLLRVVGGTHLERATALASPQPANRPSGSAPAPGREGGKVTLARLARAERVAATGYRRTAASASGLTALLWGSMAVASERFARALVADDTPEAAAPRMHRTPALVSDTDAVAGLVAGLHAVVYGYQEALGRLEPGSGTSGRATTGLRERRLLLAELSARLDAAGADVPAAKPAYLPDPVPRDPATARRLIRHLETRLLPFCGLWLAAAGRVEDRRRALDTLADTAARAERWGAKLQAWPGWPD